MNSFMPKDFILDLSRLDIKKNEIIPFPEDFRGEIYIITSKTSGKSYVGQARSHMLRDGAYKPHGYMNRWKAHLQEAFGSKRERCNVLNSAILKYGPEDFEIDLIDWCKISHIDDFQILNDMEVKYIAECNTITPNGYNAYPGGFKTILTPEQCKHHSEKLKEYYSDEKNIKRLSNIITTNKDKKKITKYESDDNIDFCYVRYHNWNTREGIRILIHFKDDKKCDKVEFRRGSTSSIEDVYTRAKQFINSTLQGKTIYIEDDNFKNYYLLNNN